MARVLVPIGDRTQVGVRRTRGVSQDRYGRDLKQAPEMRALTQD